MSIAFIKKSMVVAYKITFIFCALAWLLPFMPPFWVYGYSVFVVGLYTLLEI